MVFKVFINDSAIVEPWHGTDKEEAKKFVQKYPNETVLEFDTMADFNKFYWEFCEEIPEIDNDWDWYECNIIPNPDGLIVNVSVVRA